MEPDTFGTTSDPNFFPPPISSPMSKLETHSSNVILHIYDLAKDLNDKSYKFGFGIFHSGVEVHGKEYWFFGHEFQFTGIIILNPGVQADAGMTKRESFIVGTTLMSMEEMETTLDSLTSKYTGQSYHPIHKNCNHFSEEFCKLLLKKGIPGFVNRLAYMASWLLCVFPERWLWWVLAKVLGGSPEDQAEVIAQGEQDVTEPLINSNLEEVRIEPVQPDNPWIAFLKAAVAESPKRQRDIATQVFMLVNHGTITFDQISAIS